MADEIKAYFVQAMDEDKNIHAVYTDLEGNTVVLVLDDTPEALAPYAVRAPDVMIVKTPRFTAPPPEPVEPLSREAVALDYIDPEGRHRPPFAGISYGHYQVSAGTLGFVMQADGQQVAVSNNHVLALVNRASIGSAILQPGTADGGTLADQVAKLTRFVRLENGATVDAAIAETTLEHDLSILGIGYANGIGKAVDGQKIWKSGRTTEVSAGRTLGVDVEAEVSYGNHGTYKLKDLIITNMVSAGGDSGSPVLGFGSNLGVGLVFAGNGMLSLCIKMTNVAQQLRVTPLPAPRLTRSLWLDLSHWNPVTNSEGQRIWRANIEGMTAQSFSQMKAMGVRGVILKVCQGDYSVDDRFYEYYDLAGAEGLLCMGYTFVDPAVSGDAHYQHFINTLGARRFDWPVVLDMEIEGGKTAGVITALAQRLITLFNDWQGKNPFVYSNLSFANKNFLPWSGWKDVPLHLALWVYDDGMYPVVPNVWKDAAGKAYPGKPELWQFEVNPNGPAWGVTSKNVDMNTSNSAFEALRLSEEPPPVSFSASASPSPSPSAPPPDEKAVFEHYKGTVISEIGVNVRSGPGTSFTKIIALPKNWTVEILETAKDAEGNDWVRVGQRQWCAQFYRGSELIKYVMMGGTIFLNIVRRDFSFEFDGIA